MADELVNRLMQPDGGDPVAEAMRIARQPARPDLVNALSQPSTADIMARYRAPQWGGIKSYLPSQPEWMRSAQNYLGRGLAAIPPDVALASNFLAPGMKGALPIRVDAEALLGQLRSKYQVHSSNPPNPGGQQVSLILPDGKYVAENLPSHSMLLKGAGIEDGLESFMGKTGTVRMHGPDNYELHAEPTSRQISEMVRSARESGAASIYVDDMRGAEPRSGAFSARDIHRDLPKFLAGESVD